MMENECIFCQIVTHQAPAEIVYQDQDVTAFENIRHIAPVHLLLVPNRHISSADHAETADEPVLGKLITLAAELARQRGIAQSGYRLVINTGPDGGQSVFHLHLHLIGGRHLNFQF